MTTNVGNHAVVPRTEIVDELGSVDSRDEIAIGMGHQWTSARTTAKTQRA